MVVFLHAPALISLLLFTLTQAADNTTTPSKRALSVFSVVKVDMYILYNQAKNIFKNLSVPQLCVLLLHLREEWDLLHQLRVHS